MARYRAGYTFSTPGEPTKAYGDPTGSLAVAREEALSVGRIVGDVELTVQKTERLSAWADMPYAEWNPNSSK